MAALGCCLWWLLLGLLLGWLLLGWLLLGWLLCPGGAGHDSRGDHRRQSAAQGGHRQLPPILERSIGSASAAALGMRHGARLPLGGRQGRLARKVGKQQ